MKKEKCVQITLTYLITITNEDLNLPDDCSRDEFEDTLDEYFENINTYVNGYSFNDNEAEFFGFEDEDDKEED